MTPKESELAGQLRSDVVELAGQIGERNALEPEAYREAAAFIKKRFGEAGLQVEPQAFEAEGKTFENLETEIPGSGEVLVVGAHYDSVIGSPGANDNGSGIAALLALAERLAGTKPRRTLRLVAFANEEPPWFLGPAMGSRVYSLPGWMEGVYWSDHWSFWEEGYPALMVTDTAPFRYTAYHTQADRPDRLDYPRFARVVTGLEAVVRTLAGIE